MIRFLLFLTAFVSAIFASIPPQTNTPYAQVITESKENGTEIHYTYGNDLINDGTHYFLTDALGSTRGLVVNNAEVLTDSYDYKPYGEIASHTGSSTNSFLFTGEQFDSETNNYYLRARYYSPTLARFLSRDTYDGRASDPLSQNHYLYAGGNPILYVDPSGKFSMSSLGMSMAISGMLNVGIGYGFGTIHSVGGAAESFIIGALEGGAFYGIIGAAGKFARFVNVDKLKPYIYKVRSNFIKKVPLKPGVVPGTNIPLEYVITRKMGPVIIHSKVEKGAVEASMKHIKELLLNSGMAGKTNLAEALAMKEVEEAVQKGIIEAITIEGEMIFKGGRWIQKPTIVATEHMNVEIAIVWDSARKMYKLIHFNYIYR